MPDQPEAAPYQSRGERLREEYRGRDNWITPNGQRVSNDPEILLAAIGTYNEQLTDAALKREKLYTKYMDAQREYHAAQEAENRLKDLRDIYKLALSDAIGVPK